MESLECLLKKLWIGAHDGVRWLVLRILWYYFSSVKRVLQSLESLETSDPWFKDVW